VVASTEELRVIAALLDQERLAGQAMLTLRDGQPGLELDVAVPYHVNAPDHPGSEAAVGGRVQRYALWLPGRRVAPRRGGAPGRRPAPARILNRAASAPA
jgi:hypothetical protein